MRVALPMYDLPELRQATDALWAAPSRVRSRPTVSMHRPRSIEKLPLWDLWTAPDLLLAQTCGLPYVTRLKDRKSR